MDGLVGLFEFGDSFFVGGLGGGRGGGLLRGGWGCEELLGEGAEVGGESIELCRVDNVDFFAHGDGVVGDTGGVGFLGEDECLSFGDDFADGFGGEVGAVEVDVVAGTDLGGSAVGKDIVERFEVVRL